MNDNKLGLAIAGADRGYRIIATINEGQWIDNVRDIREDLKLIPNRRIGDSILMLTCIDSGFLLIIASPIWGRGTDYISAWIYIPDNLQISGKYLVEIVIKQTTDEILADRIDIELKDIFNTTHELNPPHHLRPADGEQQYACRYYNSDWSLTELLQPNCLYQQYYQNYKCIFFIDKSTGLTCADSVKDITNEKVLEYVCMPEPKPFHDFEPYIDGKKFNSARYFTEGERVPIEWRRDGYKPITTDTKIQEGKTEWDIPQEKQFERLITYKMFEITDQSLQPISNYHLYINNQEIYEGEEAPIPESKLRNVVVSVEADGYNKSKEMSYDLTTTTKPIQIKLEKTKYNYYFDIQVNNECCKIKMTSTQDKLNQSPIKSYVLKGKYPINPDTPTPLVYSPFDKKFWIRAAIILSTVLIIGIGLGGVLSWKFITPSQINSEQSKIEPTNKPAEQTATPEINGAIKYLDSNQTWEQKELEKFAETKGLFNALTAHDFPKISSYKGKLKGSRRFEEIMKRVEDIKEKEQEYNYKNYKGDKDSIITVEKYIQHLNQTESDKKK